MKTEPIKIDTTAINKVTVTITPYKMWHNYVEVWSDVLWDNGYSSAQLAGKQITDVASILLNPDLFTNQAAQRQLIALFRSGETCMLLGDAMQFIDTTTDILREIVVVSEDDDSKSFKIRHEAINF